MSKIPKSLTGKNVTLTKVRILQMALAVLLGLLLASGVALWQISQDEGHRLEMRQEALKPPTTSSIGGPFALTDQDGKTVRDSDFRGKYLLIYFGYTYCPDLCPTGLQSIAHAMDQLGPDADKVQPVFITIDPARDTPAKIKQYVTSFHPKIVGLTGSAAQIAEVAKEYKVYYAKGEYVDDNDYVMDHSTVIYVMDPQGAFITTFPEDMDPGAMVTALRALWADQKAEK